MRGSPSSLEGAGTFIFQSPGIGCEFGFDIDTGSILDEWISLQGMVTRSTCPGFVGPSELVRVLAFPEGFIGEFFSGVDKLFGPGRVIIVP